MAGLQRVGDGVWVLRCRPPARVQRLTNIYFLEGDGGATVFESGSRSMAPEIERAAREIGGIRRIVLSHAHADHRGGASVLDAPVYCHPDERADVEGDGGEHYFDYSKVANPFVRALAPRTVARMDGGPVKVEGTLSEGEAVDGFEVKHFPGHAPGLIGLWREADRIAIVSDAVFAFNPFTMTGRPGPVRLPPAPARPSDEAARQSIRKVAALDPASVWLGHYGPITENIPAQLERAAGGA